MKFHFFIPTSQGKQDDKWRDPICIFFDLNLDSLKTVSPVSIGK